MKDIAVTVTDWGVHAVAFSGLRHAAPASWLGPLRNAGGAGRHALFLDLRDLGDAPLPAATLGALVSVLVQPGLGRGAVLVSGGPLAGTLRDAVRREGGTAAGGVRILLSDGRDRLAIAAAYRWLLHHCEPTQSLQAQSLQEAETGGRILPFAASSNGSGAAVPLARALRKTG